MFRKRCTTLIFGSRLVNETKDTSRFIMMQQQIARVLNFTVRKSE